MPPKAIQINGYGRRASFKMQAQCPKGMGSTVSNPRTVSFLREATHHSDGPLAEIFLIDRTVEGRGGTR